MDKLDLIALIEGEESNCVSVHNGELAEQRRLAMRYYYGQPYGDEVEGRSQVVTSEVRDAVEGLLPIIMDIFTASDEIVRCDPQNPDDEAGAQQATDFLNYTFSRSTSGWVALFCAIKDALLQKNGYLKVYWDETDSVHKETYNGLTEDEFAYLSQDPELELESKEEFEDQSVGPQMGPDGNPVYPTTIDAVFKRSKTSGKICIDPVPPEEILVSRDTPNDLEKARFVEHRSLKTISEVRQMGYDIDDDIAGENQDAGFNTERQERRLSDDSWGFDDDASLNDPSMRKVWLREAFLFVDYDEDGIAEYRKVTLIGSKILDNVEFDSLPIVGGTAVIMPHKHYGQGMYDIVGDVQLIKSTITRQLLDNAYQANNSRHAVLDGMVNMDDLMTSRPGGIVRQKVMGAVQPLPAQLLGPSFYSLLEYFDQVKTNRTGSADFPGNGVDADAINAKAAYHDNVKQAAMQRPALMARCLAETLVRPMFNKILELASKHADKAKMMKLRGKWVPVDPRGWYNKFDLTVNVGLGSGSQQQVLQGAMGIMQIQGQLLQFGLVDRVVGEKNIWAAAHRYAKAVFPREADGMFNDPTGLPPPQKQPPIEMLELQQRAKEKEEQGQLKQAKMQMDFQMDQQDKQFQAGMAQMQQQNEEKMAQIEGMVKAELQQRDNQAKLQKTSFEVQGDARNSVVDAMTQLKLAEKQATEQQSQIILKGVVEQMIEAQKAQQAQMIEYQKHLQSLAEAISAPRELTKDPKTGKKTVRTVKNKD